MLIARSPLAVPCCQLAVARSPLAVPCCQLAVARCPLSVPCCQLAVARSPLTVARGPLTVARGPLTSRKPPSRVLRDFFFCLQVSYITNFNYVVFSIQNRFLMRCFFSKLSVLRLEFRNSRLLCGKILFSRRGFK